MTVEHIERHFCALGGSVWVHIHASLPYGIVVLVVNGWHGFRPSYSYLFQWCTEDAVQHLHLSL